MSVSTHFAYGFGKQRRDCVGMSLMNCELQIMPGVKWSVIFFHKGLNLLVMFRRLITRMKKKKGGQDQGKNKLA